MKHGIILWFLGLLTTGIIFIFIITQGYFETSNSDYEIKIISVKNATILDVNTSMEDRKAFSVFYTYYTVIYGNNERGVIKVNELPKYVKGDYIQITEMERHVNNKLSGKLIPEIKLIEGVKNEMQS